MRENLNKINWAKVNNIVPAIIQDSQTFQVLMLGFMNKEAINLTLQNNKVYFFSRTKQRIWMKGEESGNFLELIDIKLDCDNDTLLILVIPQGNTCHLDFKSCFGNDTINFLYILEDTIRNRIDNFLENSYVSKLNQQGLNRIVQKVGEEATEVIIAALNEQEKLLDESADLLFHLIILLNKFGFSINDVIDKLQKRTK